MLDQDFCLFLEYELTKAFPNSSDASVRNFWCDGVLLPDAEKYLSPKSVNDKRYIPMGAFSGESGQDRYELILSFGRKSLSRYARGLDIKECVPSPEDSNWIEVNQEQKTIMVRLL